MWAQCHRPFFLISRAAQSARYVAPGSDEATGALHDNRIDTVSPIEIAKHEARPVGPRSRADLMGTSSEPRGDRPEGFGDRDPESAESPR
jgi:hypothetical protein